MSPPYHNRQFCRSLPSAGALLTTPTARASTHNFTRLVAKVKTRVPTARLPSRRARRMRTTRANPRGSTPRSRMEQIGCVWF
eukprot:4652484-Pleurochrysis_carterae.AAC.1